MQRISALICLLGVLLAPGKAAGAFFYVRAGGDDASSGSSPATALASLREAGKRAINPGDIVIVGPGRYQEGDIGPTRGGVPQRPVAFIGDSTGFSTGDAPGPVLIDVALQRDTGFLILGRPHVVISGFHITGARVAAIQVRPSRQGQTSEGAIIANNVIFSNGGPLVGRGVQIEGARDVVVFNNLIYANSSVGVSVGGAPAPSGAQLINNTIYGHSIAGIKIGVGADTQVETTASLPAPGAWVLNNIVSNNRVSIDVNTRSGCSYVGAHNLVSDDYSDTTPRDRSDLSAPAPFLQPEGKDGVLGGSGFADDDFGLPPSSAARGTGSEQARLFGLTATTASGRVDLGFHRGNTGYPRFTELPVSPLTLYVLGSGNDANDGRAPAQALRTIRRAISRARANTRIVVGPGAYVESDLGLDRLTPAGPVQFVADTGGQATDAAPGPVLLDARGGETGFVMVGRCGVVIDGFTVTNAATAGIQIRNGSHGSTLRNNVVFSNQKRGIDVVDSHDVKIVNNLAYANGTGGIQVASSRTGSRRAIVHSNTCYGNGANGIQIGTAGPRGSICARVRYNVIQGNGKNGIQVGSNATVDRNLTGYLAEFNLNADRYGAGTPRPGSDLWSDPLLVDPAGPDRILGGEGHADDFFCLGHQDAGQPETSPAFDFAPITADEVRLSARSARCDGVLDGGALDLGYHFAAGPGSADSPLVPAETFPEYCYLDENTREDVLPGDCNGDGTVTIDEIIRGVNIAVGNVPVTECLSFDVDGDGQVTVNELLVVIQASLL